MATFENREKPGTNIGGWDYNEDEITYNESLDPDTNLTVFYNGLGVSTNWSNETKN